MLKYYLIFKVLAVALMDLSGQVTEVRQRNQEQTVLPRVFLLGNHEQPYEEMMERYDKLFINVFKDDLDKAYEVWSGFLLDLEAHSRTLGFELNGLKLWLNVFFNEDGGIQHLVYFPKPNSRNMNFDQLSHFFMSFSKDYHLKESPKIRCSHFGSASFPTYLR